MTKIDFHVHTSYSPDAFNDPFKIVKHAKRKGLDGIAITDHNNLKAINISVPGDPSSAAFFVALCLLNNNSKLIIVLSKFF